MTGEATGEAAEAAPRSVDVVAQVADLMDPDRSAQLLDQGKALLLAYGPKVLAAVVVFYVGKWSSKWARRLVERMMKRADVDPMIIGFTSSLVHIGLMVFVVLAALGQLGIQTTSFIAVLGAAGLAIGLAFQGSLANFAAGFLLIVFRPFKVGDVIEAAGVTGKVEAIHIFTTTLLTGDNKTIIVPNAKLGNDNIINYSKQARRRVDITVGVAYDSDLKEVRKVLEEVVESDERILAEPQPQVVVGALADSSIDFFVRAWTRTGDYWGVYFDLNERIKNALDAAGIEIPYPTMDVNLRKVEPA